MALITTTKNGRPLYRVRWNYRDRSIDGKPYDERDFRDEAEAYAFDARKNHDTSSVTERITVHEACQHWLDLHVEGLELRTIKHYRAEVNLRIRPGLGSRRLATLTPAVITRWRRDLLAEHSANSANKALQALKAMNRWARGEGISTNRSFDDVKPLSVEPAAEPNPYKPSEIDAIASAFPRMRDRTLVLVAAYSGLRWSELVALEWRDVDLDAKQPTIRVARSLDLGKGFQRKAPKSGKARTTLLLNPGAIALREWRQHTTNHKGVVFPSRSGNPLGSAWYKHDKSSDEPTAQDGPLGRARKLTGIHIEPHQLRDTFASIMVASGVGEIELAEMMAHASLQTTRKHYVRAYPQRVASAGRAANDLIASLG